MEKTESEPQSESKEVLDFGLEENSPQVNPKQWLHRPRSHHAGTDASFSSSGHGSSDISLKEGSESSSLSSDSESESNSSINSYLGSVMPLTGPGKHKKRSEHGSYEGFVGEVMHSEEQFMGLKQKLQNSEKEVKSLKGALDQSESIAHGLQVLLEAAHAEIKMKDCHLEEEANANILALEEQIVALGIHISDYDHKTETFMKELSTAQEKLDKANEDTALLLTQLDSEKKLAVELQERISGYTDDLCDRECQILELQHDLSNEKQEFAVKKEQLLSNNSSLLEKQQQLGSRCTQLEANLRQCEEERQAMKELHDAKLRSMEVDFDQLKMVVAEKDRQIDDRNKDLDKLKLSRDMVVAEKDGLGARVETLLAELRCREIQVEEFSSGSANAEKLVGELRSRVEELEKEVDIQNVVISEGAEKKKEAIRQLCFTLEHYRSGYLELRQAFLMRKRRAARASS